MGPFPLTQPNPIHQLTDPNQPNLQPNTTTKTGYKECITLPNCRRVKAYNYGCANRVTYFIGWVLSESLNEFLTDQIDNKRNGRPAEYRWCPLFNAAKFGRRALLECRAVTLPRRETSWKLKGCPKLANKSQPLVGRSSPYYQDMWRRYCCLTSFFPIVDTCLSSEEWRYSPTKLCNGAKMAIFCVLHFQRAACSTFQTCILNSH